ncbi:MULTISPECIES: hypothetical protein [Streptomyces]|uniref:Uncharacterized protein n=1 Tax=Streptomyces solicathayae TaxID=3081768 RepID=A0ABZ0LKT5_9ACTN|nr:hypothetical protein [Streptomyces sp. HUAS YS2]WOX20117.1 hypothetical protein R2D22_01395 [Streptomyces sp. HUAS YS2]
MAELQIDHLRGVEDGEARVVVRCLRGPVRRGARFVRIVGLSAPVDLELTGILLYGRPSDELPTAYTALVTLSGTGTHLLAAGDRANGWQILQGADAAV